MPYSRGLTEHQIKKTKRERKTKATLTQYTVKMLKAQNKGYRKKCQVTYEGTSTKIIPNFSTMFKAGRP